MISVLLVDDEDALLDLTKTFLEKAKDIEVTATLSAFDALTLMESATFQAVVSDYEMPLMNGIDFLKAVKSRGDDTPFIIFTGRGREYVAIDALNNGAAFYLQKGGDVTTQYAELRNMIHQAVQRRQSEQALLTSEERYRAVVESQMELICRFRPDGTYLFVNGAFCRYYSKTIDELVGHRYHPKTSPEDRLLIDHHFSSLTPENPTGTMEHRIICPHSGTRWQQWSDTAIFGERGEVLEFQSVGRDITDKKQTEDELKNTLSLIEATLESTDNGILVVNREGKVIKMNGRFAEMWHIPVDLLAEGNDKKLQDEILNQLSDPDTIIARIREVYSKPEEESHDLLYFNDGRVFEHNSKPMLVAREPRGRVWSFLDITERIRAEKVLMEANKKLYLLNTVTRHDVLNQLTAISSMLQLAHHKDVSNHINELLVRAENSVDVIERQIAFMSDYQDIDIHTPHWQNPVAILTNVRAAIPLADIRLESDLANLEIYADPLLEKVFLNLVDNAVRHGGGTSRVRFYSRVDNGELLIFCEDDGQGILPGEKERIFNLGYGKHTGFGLYLAREILSITEIAINEIGEPGKGALFRMRIPRKGFRTMLERVT
ncbi:PAS domain S-box protein [uncultured Methanoregula sp.]|uniref:PAS domain S-box protein n=1 Tax=uncultured Methanoregula sp. TaxID=1005933 RepID=UPI002AAB0DA1|nr:PAS domain S-box protein [uncultured Methanoregula sp.]